MKWNTLLKKNMLTILNFLLENIVLKSLKPDENSNLKVSFGYSINCVISVLVADSINHSPVSPSVGWSIVTFGDSARFLRPQNFENFKIAPIHHCPCLLARDKGCRVSSLVCSLGHSLWINLWGRLQIKWNFTSRRNVFLTDSSYDRSRFNERICAHRLAVKIFPVLKTRALFQIIDTIQLMVLLLCCFAVVFLSLSVCLSLCLESDTDNQTFFDPFLHMKTKTSQSLAFKSATWNHTKSMIWFKSEFLV